MNLTTTIAIVENQTHEGVQRGVAWCEANVKNRVRLLRTQGISSSMIESNVIVNDIVVSDKKLIITGNSLDDLLRK